MGGRNSAPAALASVDSSQHGVYLLTLADGAQWRVIEGVDDSYRVPRSGDTLTIERVATG